MFKKIKNSFVLSFLNPFYWFIFIKFLIKENSKIDISDKSFQNNLRFSLMPSYKKDKNLSGEDKKRFTELNRQWNKDIYSKDKGFEYEKVHEYGGGNYTQFATSRLLVEHILEKKYKNVLEIGAGTGYHTIRYSDFVGQVDAVELGADLIEKFRKNIEEKNASNINIIEADIDNFRSEKKYDCIIFISALHHIPFRIDLFKKIILFLENNGDILLIEPHHNLFRKFSIILDFYRKKINNFNCGHDSVSRAELNFYCKETGLELKTFNTFNNRFLGKVENNKRFKLEKIISNVPVLKNFQDCVFSVLKKK